MNRQNTPPTNRFIRLLARCACLVALLATLGLQACSGQADYFRDENMDFGAVRNVAVMPLANLSKDNLASDRVRDVFATMLMATGAVYVLPYGEVASGIASAGITNPYNPTPDEVVKFAKIVKADAVITGVIREYGEVRSGSASSVAISLSMQMIESQTGRIVWSASTTKGGISVSDRIFGGGGRPLNDVTEQAVNDILTKFFE
jgi:hypothetical protein